MILVTEINEVALNRHNRHPLNGHTSCGLRGPTAWASSSRASDRKVKRGR